MLLFTTTLNAVVNSNALLHHGSPLHSFHSAPQHVLQPEQLNVGYDTRHAQHIVASKHIPPLKLCFAKTIHTFQGSNARPEAPDQQQNAKERLIIDMGNRTI
jgi:hypothetical protein